MLKTILAQHRQVLKTFSSREAAAEALDQLVLSGFPIAQIFLLSNGTKNNLNSLTLSCEAYGTVTGTASGLKKGMCLGNLAGGTAGLCLGAGLIALPGVGQLALSEMITFILLSGGVCTAAGGLIGALTGLAFTSGQTVAFRKQAASGSVLLLVEGTVQEIDRARDLLKKLAD